MKISFILIINWCELELLKKKKIEVINKQFRVCFVKLFVQSLNFFFFLNGRKSLNSFN